MSKCENCFCLDACREHYRVSESGIRNHDNCKCFVDRTKYVEVVYGRWDRGECSACKAINPAYTKDWNGDYIFKKTNYCPNCGAKMDREI